MKFWQQTRNALAILGALLILAHITPLGRWYALALAGEWDQPRSGVLLILGAEMQDEKVLGLHSFRRMYYGLWYYQRGNFDGIVVLGENVGNSMKEWLVHYGVSPDKVHVGRKSRSTRENAREAAEIVRQHPEWKGPFWVLTSDFHVFRAGREFRKQGMVIRTQPVPDVLKQWEFWWQRYDAWTALATESLKIGYSIWQ